MRYLPTRFRYRPCHCRPLRGITSPRNGSASSASIAAVMRRCTFLESRVNCRSATSESSACQLMFDLLPRFGLALPELPFPLTDYHCLFRRQHVLGIYNLLGLDNHRAFDLLNFHVVTDRKAELLADILGDHHLPTLADFADRHDDIPLFSCMIARMHIIRVSDGQSISSTAQHVVVGEWGNNSGRTDMPTPRRPSSMIAGRAVW